MAGNVAAKFLHTHLALHSRLIAPSVHAIYCLMHVFPVRISCMCFLYVFPDALNGLAVGYEASEGSGQVVLSQFPIHLLQVVLQLH